MHIKHRSYHLDYGLVSILFLALGFSLLFSWLAMRQHWAFNTHGFDLGLFHNVVWNTAHGNWFQHSYHAGITPSLINHFGDHVQPILLPISWLYWIYDGPETLLILQAFIVGSAAIPVFLLGRRVLHNDKVAFVFALLFLLHPAIQSAILFDFHPVVLATSFLLWAFYFLESKRYGMLIVAIILALFSKENISLVVALFGMYFLLKKRGKLGFFIIFLGVAWFLLSFFIILPAFNPGTGSNAFARYSYLGSTWFEVILSILTKPNVIWQRITDPLSIMYLKGLFLPLGMLSFFSPVILLIAASELGLNLLSSFDAQRSINYQYSVIIVSIAIVAAIYGLNWLSIFIARYLKVSRKSIVILGAVWGLVATIGFHLINYGTLRPWGTEYLNDYKITEHDILGTRFITQIPANVPISAQSDLTPHVSQRKTIYLFPTVKDAEYIFLDTQSTIFPVHFFPIEGMSPDQAYKEYINRLLNDGSFTTIDYEDGWLLLKRSEGKHQAIPNELQEFLTGAP